MINKNCVITVVLILVCFCSCFSQASSSLSKRNNNNHDHKLWNYKFSFTTTINSQLSIDCLNDDQIWIGWSHYGTRAHFGTSDSSKSANNRHLDSVSSSSIRNSQYLNFPNENDCWMNFTEKIAEQCNGSPNCDISSQPTYIHKCNKISDYIYVAYKCIKAFDTFDICKSDSRVYTHEQLFQHQQHNQGGFYIKSPDFPIEYPSSVDCSCSIQANTMHPLKLDVLWFSLQDNDYLNMFNRNLTGWINPTYEMPIMSKSTTIRFSTDDGLAYKGFWLKVASRRACKDDWQLVGDSCVKVFTESVDWRSANQRCQLMNGHLVKIDDVVNDLKLTQYMKSFYPEVGSYWIGLRKYADDNNQERWMWSSLNNSTVYNDISWWPWRRQSSSMASTTSTVASMSQQHSPNNHCVVKRKGEDGYFAIPCDSSNKNSFICQTETIQPSASHDLKNAQIKLQCGSTEEIRKLEALAELNKPNDLLLPDVGIASIKFIQQNDNNNNNKMKNTKLDPLNVINSISSEVDDELNNKSSEEATTSTSTTTKHRRPSPATAASKQASLSSLFPLRNYQISTNEAKSAPSQLNTNNTTKYNTTVLAGMISGIGLVIILINLGVIFLCRRNLKKFIKSTKETRNARDDMIQEYFDAFNTLHNINGKTIRGGAAAPSAAAAAAALGLGLGTIPAHHTLHSLHNNLISEGLLTMQQKQQLRSNSNSSGEELLLNETSPAQIFYNGGPAQTFSRDLNIRQSMSAFKQLSKDDANALQQHLLLINNSATTVQRQNNNSNQYDKMNHHAKLGSSPVVDDNSSNGQYAHTYESLDILDVPNKRTLVHLGINGRNYRTVNDVLMQGTNQQLSPASSNFQTNIENTTNTTEVGNLSSTSSSSSSGSSSTHQFLRNNNNIINPNSQHLLMDQQHLLQQFQQHQPAAQIITLNDLKQFNHLLLHNNQHLLQQQQQQQQQQLMSSGGTHESWSPDSAYYSSIPTLNTVNYPLHQQQVLINANPSKQQQQQQQQQPTTTFTFNMDQQFKSHLV